MILFLVEPNDSEDEVGLCRLGIIETVIPLHAGSVEPPKNKTNQRQKTAPNMLFTKVIGIENKKAKIPSILHSSKAITRWLKREN
jgi:hypothetical protein